MRIPQLIVFAVLAVMLGLFIWNRWRYDIVAVGGLLVVALAGLIPPDQVFSGLGHPAVITVAAVLVMSQGLIHAGVVDTLARRLTRVGDRPIVQVAALTTVVALSSAFMNNIGALALLMPVAVWMARRSRRSPSFILMPLAFGSLLGGTLTLIGTPSNIIIASFRDQATGTPFGMFDFAPVGLGITLCGLLFITLVGWRLTPRRNREVADDLFEIGSYLTELRVPEESRFANRTLHELAAAVEDEADIAVTCLLRGDRRIEMPPTYEVLRPDDILIVETDSDGLSTLLDVTGLALVAKEDGEASRTGAKDLNLVEAIVTPDAGLVGQTATSLHLRERYGVNVLAVARQGHRLQERLGRIRFAAGDILLVQGEDKILMPALRELGCLPLESRGLRIGRPRHVILAGGIFAAALVLIALGLLPAPVAMTAGAVVMVLAGLIAPTDIYKSIDIPVIVLLAALIPISQALENTGGSQLLADGLLAVSRSAPPMVTLAILMTATMLLSNLINNAAAAVLAAPVGMGLAEGLGAAVDPFLMAVAIGASCAFLTPIGHQSNTLVLTPGGYRFGDYWRMGLPLSLLVVGTAVPLIAWVWPV